MATVGIDDLSHLENLDVPSILETLRNRFERDKTYTACGDILISINPYKSLPIFDVETHEQYDWRKFDASAQPHVFNVAARAYRNMRETETNQVILVSGESGAGKTENTKFMVKHFVHMCPHENSGNLHEKVVKVNPLLEAFGNAQTIMNDNSSRFAKYLELCFDDNGQVMGAVVRDYMLEKSRVVNYSYDEGNFHIFYSLFAGSSRLKELSLTRAKDYRIMSCGDPALLAKTDHYSTMYTEQMSVLSQIGFSEEDVTILHCMLGAIIHLTEVKFREPEQPNDPLDIVNLDHVNTAAKLLNVNAVELSVALLKIKTEYMGDVIQRIKSKEQANDGRDALAKALYERAFGWIIRKINEDLNPVKQRGQTTAVIGILDIAGFENLHSNSFEQLCINFVNERLQNFMNDSVFKREKAIYEEEEIDIENIDFKNNLNIIDVFEKKIGIFNLLEEETKLQQGTDLNFVLKVINNNSESGVIQKSQTNNPEFGIIHFAGKVWYHCEGFLEKNKDRLNDDLFDCMKDSENEFIQDLFTVAKGPTGTISETKFNIRKSTRHMALSRSTKRSKQHSDDTSRLYKDLGRSMKRRSDGPPTRSPQKKYESVSSYFRASMSKLLEKMKQADAHFVRCIKPNNKKGADNFDKKRIEEQLVYNGISEISKIRKMGYAVRRQHSDFYKRYSVLDSEFSGKSEQNVQSLLEKILPSHLKGDYRIGKHRVFLKEPVHTFLERCVFEYEEEEREKERLRKIEEEKQRKEEEKRKREDEKRKREEEEEKERENAQKEKARRQREEEDRKRAAAERLKRELDEKIEEEQKKGISESFSTQGDSSSLSTTQGSTDSDTSSSAKFGNLSATRRPDGGLKKIQRPLGIYDDDEDTVPKTTSSSGKGKAPLPPIRPPPSRQESQSQGQHTRTELPAEKKKDQKEFWDIFANIPREKKSKDVHERGSLRLIKVITYGLLFLVLFASLVFQKISLMLLVKRQDRNFSEVPLNPLHTSSRTDDHKLIFEQDENQFNSARYLLLLLAICIPYGLTVLISILKVLFGNLPWPNKSTIFVATFMECAHSVGLGFLAFKYLGEMHAARGIMVMSAVCILPSILKPFFAKEDADVGSRGRTRWIKKIGSFLADLMAVLAQISVIPMVVGLGYLFENESPSSDWRTIVEVAFCMLLCSFSWWENFMDDRAFGKNGGRLSQFILQIKFDLQEGRPTVTMITSVFKIAMTIIMAYVLKDNLNLDVSLASGTLTADRYENALPSALYEHYPYIKDYTSIICLTIGSYIAYYLAYTICKLRMQIVSFSLACLLSTPAAVGIVLLDCSYDILLPFTKEDLECFPHKSYNTSHWYHFLIGLMWLMSAYWIARYIWFPNQERLAKVERLFVNPLYCSILLEQHLIMNRKRHNKRIRREIKTKLDREDPNKSRSEIFYRLSSDEHKHTGGEDRSKMKKIPPMIYACATMWHENRLEMVQILKSLYRVDIDQFVRRQAVELHMAENPDFDPEEFEYYEFQIHILFDDAFEFDDDEDRVPNSFVKLFMEVMQEAANAIHKKHIKLDPPVKIPSPYGAQLVFRLPGENLMYVHLKDKNKIRHRKRWSQVMYMYYLLGYRIVKECQERVLLALDRNEITDLASWDQQQAALTGKVGRSQIFNILDDEVIYRAENTFILALDGDVDFTPKAIRLLVDRMQKNEVLGAACGRIHPIGKGPMVWYQKFEYAVAHWLQKSTEHVLGCVLCSPGCFSLFRGSALMDDNIMRKYTIKPTEASHHLMYDQGEDRWLCTLLLQQGYRVDYAAASDAYTYAPEGFGEFFNQRRRWMPSTMANIMDLLTDAKNTVSVNKNISWLYMIYQGALMVSTLIGPSTVIMMIAGAYLTVFKLDLLTSYAIAIAPALLYTILCFTVKAKYQILAAEIFSAIYAFIMMVVFVGCIITAVQESPFHPSVIFLCSMVFIFLFAAVLHPWEFFCIIHGILYFLCVPSGFLLLVIYSLCNLHIISWGTREVPRKKTKAEIAEEERKKKEKEEKKKKGWLSRLMPKFQLQDLKGLMEITKKEDKTTQLLEQMNKNFERFLGTKGQSGTGEELTEVHVDTGPAQKPPKSVRFSASVKEGSDDEEISQQTEEEDYIYQKEKKKRDDMKNPKWLESVEFKKGGVIKMNDEERDFWEKFIEKYLKPIDTDETEKKKVNKELAELRNNVTAGFAFINLIWIAINFMFQLRKPAIITFPIAKDASSDDVSDDNIKIDALGLMFVIFFVIILLIQFIGMIVHRWGTFMHLIAITEIPNPFSKKLNQQGIENENNARNPKDIVQLCERIVGEPMPDYPSDDEDEEELKKIREEDLLEKIENLATQGVVENLRDTTKIGISLRDTRSEARNMRATRLRDSIVRNANFRSAANDFIARSRHPVDFEEEPAFTPNVLRQRGRGGKSGIKTGMATRRFGDSAPALAHFMDKIQERKLDDKYDGLRKQSGDRHGNLGSTYRPGNLGGTSQIEEEEDDIYDKIPAQLGTVGRAFQKKLRSMAKTAVRPSDTNGGIQFGDQIEMFGRRDDNII